MVFARCLAVESDFVFTSTTARTSHSGRATADATAKPAHVTRFTSMASHQRSSSATAAEATDARSSFTMPAILGWGRKSSTSNAKDSSEVRRSTSNNQEPHSLPCKTHHSHHHHHQHNHNHKKELTMRVSQSSNPHGGSTSTSSGVKIRRGDKSFLEFHQNYAITRHLGEGSYSTVKQVTHRKRGGLYACKIVDKSALSPIDRIALSQEVHVLASVCHDHIMQLHEVIEDDTKCYLIMELAEHGDLFDKIVKQGKFPEEEAQMVTAALCEALYYCHSNAIIHRDVKPENVLLSGDAHAVKLCDFGFAKQLRDVTEKSVDSCGTPGYAAPEILDGKPYGLEVDVFSLGVVTYIMLCGYPPFPMKLSQLRTHRFNVRFPSKDWANVDPAVKDMIIKMLHVNPALRPKMGELKELPWIKRGKQILDDARAVAEERSLAEALQRKQLIADTIRKKLTSTTGFEVVKHGRQGQPHRTKLRLSTDGRVLSWQPKLVKRGLLKYHQNAKSITSFFGFGNKSSKPKPPQPSRLSMLDTETESEAARSSEAGRFSEPIFCDDAERSASASVGSATDVSVGILPNFHGSQQLAKTDSTSSTTSTGSASWIDRKNWWRPFRRSDKAKFVGTAEGRSASGGVTFPRFSLTETSSNQPPPPASRSHSSSSSSCSVASAADSYESVDRNGSSRTSFASNISEPASPTGYLSPGVSPRMSMRTPPMSPSANATSERILDTSVNLRDIRTVTLGEHASFFQSSKRCCCCNETCGSNRTDATTSATDSAIDSDDDNKKVTDDEDPAEPELNVATTMTVATRYRELHLEFPSEEMRDAFAFLLEQATLPLAAVSCDQPSFIVRSALTPTQSTAQVEKKRHPASFAHPEDGDVEADADGTSDDDDNDSNNNEHE